MKKYFATSLKWEENYFSQFLFKSPEEALADAETEQDPHDRAVFTIYEVLLTPLSRWKHGVVFEPLTKGKSLRKVQTRRKK